MSNIENINICFIHWNKQSIMFSIIIPFCCNFLFIINYIYFRFFYSHFVRNKFINIFTQNAEEYNNPACLIDEVVRYISFNVPNVSTRFNLPVSLNITANRVALKTSKFFSVEWSFKYDKEGNISDITSVIGTFTKERNPEELDAMINILKDSWNVKELNK